MATTNVSFRVDSDLKKEAEELFQFFGLSMNSAFTMFLRQSVTEQSIPFNISKKTENERVIEQLQANSKMAMPRISLKERFEKYPEHDFENDKEIDWGLPVGDEVW